MSKKMKNTYIWTALAIFPAIILSISDITPRFFERIGLIALCVPWLIGALMEKEKKAWIRFYIVLVSGILLAAITYFIRANLNGENAVTGMVVTLIVTHLQGAYALILEICAMVILWKTRKQELAIREEKQEQKEWVNNRVAKKEKITSPNVDVIRGNLDNAMMTEVPNDQALSEQETNNIKMQNQIEKPATVRKGRTLDL